MPAGLNKNERAILKAIAEAEDLQVGTAKLTRDLGVSRVSICRYLSHLKEFAITWVRGSVGLIHRMSTDLSERVERAGDAKRAIARSMAELIADEMKGRAVFLDSGSTCLLLAQAMKDQGCSDVMLHTLNPLVISEFYDYAAIRDIYVIGGRLSRAATALSGDSAARQLGSEAAARFDCSFLGVDRVLTDGTLALMNDYEAAQKSAVVKKSGVTYVLADHTKLSAKSGIPFWLGTDGIWRDKANGDDVRYVIGRSRAEDKSVGKHLKALKKSVRWEDEPGRVIEVWPEERTRKPKKKTKRRKARR